MSKPDKATLPVFLSYPKSGRTWISYALDLAGAEMHFSHAGTGSRSHAMGHAFRGICREKYAGRRIIFMHRNPIDTTVSFFFQVHRRELIRGTWKYYRRYPRYASTGRWPPNRIENFFMHPGYGVEKVCLFNRAWIDHLSNQNGTLLLSYEDLANNGETTLAKVLSFLGQAPDRAIELIEKSRFEKMQALEATNQQGRTLTPGVQGDPESMKVRRGKVRGYVDYLDAAMIARCREITARYGFDA
jgi:hypothetical protein